MKFKTIPNGRRWLAILMILIQGIGLAACAGNAGKAASVQQTATTFVAVPTGTFTPSPLPSQTPTSFPTPVPSSTPTQKPSPTPTQQPLSVFQTRLLYSHVTPTTYLEDTCRYLQLRWTPESASPGTVVVPVMYHGVRRSPGTVSDNITVTQKYFEETMAHAKELGFETITIAELVDFLNNNAPIPKLSLLMIIDDRRLGTVREHFLPILEEYQWDLTMAYITGVINDQEWIQVKEVLATGRVGIEAHGFLHNGETYFTEFTPPEIIDQEIYAPIESFTENLGYRPQAFIWPGGNFTLPAVQELRAAGYQVGFTAYSRGPVMFNWIPLGAPELEMNDPVLLLPRYWSTSAYNNLDEAVEISKQAEAYAFLHQQEELDWYEAYCPDDPIISPLQIPTDPNPQTP